MLEFERMQIKKGKLVLTCMIAARTAYIDKFVRAYIAVICILGYTYALMIIFYKFAYSIMVYVCDFLRYIFYIYKFQAPRLKYSLFFFYNIGIVSVWVVYLRMFLNVTGMRYGVHNKVDKLLLYFNCKYCIPIVYYKVLYYMKCLICILSVNPF
jgi:hypothetical protein